MVIQGVLKRKQDRIRRLAEGSPRKGWQNEGRLVDLLVVVSAKLLLLLWGERAQRVGEVAGGILGADHEADLAGGVGWDGRVGVLDVREDLLAVLLELSDQWEMEPLVLSCRRKLAMV
jgi:hypothetical protein